MSAAEPAMKREAALAQAEMKIKPLLVSRANLAPIKRFITLQRLNSRVRREAQLARRAAVERAEAKAAKQMTLAAERLAQEVMHFRLV